MTLIYLRGYRGGEEIAVTQLFDTFKDWRRPSKRVSLRHGLPGRSLDLPVVAHPGGRHRVRHHPYHEYRLTRPFSCTSR